MANIVNNFKAGNSTTNFDIKKLILRLRKWDKELQIKEVYYNNILVWKNANPFVFTQKLADIDLKNFGTDTIIFEGFNAKDLEGNSQIVLGSYSVVENAEEEKDNLTKGQMVVETTDGEK